jgi:hypothetical protein
MPIACQEFPIGTLHHAIRPSQSGRPASRGDSVDEAHELLFDDDSRLRCTLAKLRGKPAALDWLGAFMV